MSFRGGYHGNGYGSLSFLLSAPMPAQFRKLHNLDETSDGRHAWRIRATVSLSGGGVATYVTTIAYRVKNGKVVGADSASFLPLIALDKVEKENIAAFEKKVESMKGNFGPFPSAKCEVLK